MKEERSRISTAAALGIVDFWVVTKPTEESELSDICFLTDIYGLQKQFRGGLNADSIIAFYVAEQDAKLVAKELLKDFGNAFDSERFFRNAAQQ